MKKKDLVNKTLLTKQGTDKITISTAHQAVSDRRSYYNTDISNTGSRMNARCQTSKFAQTKSDKIQYKLAGTETIVNKRKEYVTSHSDDFENTAVQLLMMLMTMHTC